MDEITARDRAELACREESRHGNVTERAPHGVHIMVGLTEQSLTSPVAREEESPCHRRGALRLEHRAKVLAR